MSSRHASRPAPPAVVAAAHACVCAAPTARGAPLDTNGQGHGLPNPRRSMPSVDLVAGVAGVAWVAGVGEGPFAGMRVTLKDVDVLPFWVVLVTVPSPSLMVDSFRQKPWKVARPSPQGSSPAHADWPRPPQGKQTRPKRHVKLSLQPPSSQHEPNAPPQLPASSLQAHAGKGWS